MGLEEPLTTGTAVQMVDYVALGDNVFKQILQIRPLEALSLLFEVFPHASDAGCRCAIPNAWVAALVPPTEECTVTLLNQEGGNHFPLSDDCH